MEILDTVVVGAGQAGLGISFFLKRDGRRHVVLERGRIGESWLSQRWDSFSLNTPNFMSTLPGLPYDGLEPDGFWGSTELVTYFQRYVDHFQLPVQTGIEVLSVEQADDRVRFLVKTKDAAGTKQAWLTRSVVIAAGSQQRPRVPALLSRIPKYILQLHTATYRRASVLPEGAVVVVGSGQSGVQIAEDLLLAGRKVYLCTSRVGRVPRRYRGRDILEWWIDMKFLDVLYDHLEDKSTSRNPQPQVSGIGRRGHTLSLQSLHHRGAVILGGLLDVETGGFKISDEAAPHVKFADAFSRRVKDEVDAWLRHSGVTLPQQETDLADVPDPHAECVCSDLRLDPVKAKVGTLIWATGFDADFSWIHLPVLDPQGKPVHTGGISPVHGLYFLGFPWLSSRKSGIIYGVSQDAGRIARAIGEQLG